jgi:hypothetical protein
MSKHTPGPWTFVQGGSGDFPTWNVRIGSNLVTLPFASSMETLDADARLISAAPDLLDALFWALSQIEDDLDPDHQAALASAWAAIAKAKGE